MRAGEKQQDPETGVLDDTSPLTSLLFSELIYPNRHVSGCPVFFPVLCCGCAALSPRILCTAGCVDAPSDPIVGTYVSETDTSVSYAVFENDGTGLFAESAETDESAGVLQGTFNWTAVEPKKTYTLLFADGAAETAALDAEHGLLTIGEVEYQKYPSGYSGKVVLYKSRFISVN